MTFIAATVVLEVVLVIVACVAFCVLVRNVPLGFGFEIEVKLLPPSIRLKGKDRS
jgi:hypothetical protein